MRAARGREATGKRDVTMGQKGSRWAPPLLAAALAVGLPPGDQARTIHPAPAVWRTAALGQPGPAAPGWTRTSVALRDARGDTEYRWGLVPAGLAPSGAFLDAAVWPTTATAARHNAQARAAGARRGRRRPPPALARWPCGPRPDGLGARLSHADPLHAAGWGNVPQRPVHGRALQRPPAALLRPRAGLARPRAPSVVGAGRRL